MSADWPKVALGDILTSSDEWTEIRPDETYKQVTVKLWGQGVVLRNVVGGGEITGQKRFVVRQQQFLLSRIDARNGAFGLVPDFLDGAVVSNDFPAFDLDTSRIFPGFLGWMSKTQAFVNICKAASEGTTNRVRLKKDLFLDTEIPLPPLNEQRRTVARIEELAAKIEEAQKLRRQAAEEAEALSPTYLGNMFKLLADKYGTKNLGDLSSQVTDGPHKTPNYVLDGIPFVTVKNMVTGKLDFSNVNYILPEDHLEFSKRCKPEMGDVLYSKDGATRGNPCFVDTNLEFNIFVSVALIKPIRDLLDGNYLCYVLKSRWIKDRMSDKSRGDMIPHIVLREIKNFPIPHPTIDEQRRIVSRLDELQAQVDGLKRHQVRTAEELDALLPAVLDRAFRGQL